jgi:hypothetical protein
MSKKPDIDAETCYYCGAPIAASGGERDHFPRPKRNGGEETVPACLPCHNMKDRMSFKNWPIEWAVIKEDALRAILEHWKSEDFEGLVAYSMDAWSGLQRHERLWLAKALAKLSDHVHGEPDPESFIRRFHLAMAEDESRTGTPE